MNKIFLLVTLVVSLIFFACSESSSTSSDSDNENAFDSPWNEMNEDVEYGEFRDARDGHIYKTVVIGDQTWMAENLNYRYVGIKYRYHYRGSSDTTEADSDSTSWCYGGDGGYVYNLESGSYDKKLTKKEIAANCRKYGRLYTWSAVMDSAGLVDEKNKVVNDKNGFGCGYGTTCTPNTPHRGICPLGWHVPTNEEFDVLRSVTNEKIPANSWVDGFDSLGFSLLPAGYRYESGEFQGMGDYAALWSASQYSDSAGSIYYENGYGNDSFDMGRGRSLRCVKD